MRKRTAVIISFFIIGAGPDRNRCDWWLRFLGEVSEWEVELQQAKEAHDWEKAQEIRRIIDRLQKRGALDE